jgi:hypothetical protein
MNSIAQIRSNALEAEGLRRLVAALIEAIKPGEQAFLALGERLDQAVQVIDRLTNGLTELSEMVDGEQVGASAEGLRSAVGKVGEIASGLGVEGEDLGKLAATLSGGSRTIDQLRKTVGEVASLGINAKIQVAQITANTDFAVFTSEVARLAGLAAAGLDALDLGFKSVGSLITQAHHGHAAFAQESGQALAAVAERLTSSLVLMDNHHHKTRDVVLAICRRSAEIAMLIGEAVISLQANDITRQRIEHVVAAIDRAAELLGPAPMRAAAGLPEGERRQLAAIICRLQAAQLDSTAVQFEAELRRLLRSLDSLASDADKMLRQEISMGAGNQDSLFARLSNELEEAKRLYNGFAEGRAGSRRLIAEVTQAAGRMVGHVDAVHEIEADIRVMGLNATLKCGWLGNEGRGLAIIAQELRHCAKRTEEQAVLVNARLHALVAATASFAEGKDEASTALQTASVIGAMSSSLDYLLATQTVFEERLPSMVAEAEHAKVLLGEAASRTDIHQSLGSALRQAVNALAAWGDGETDEESPPELIRRALDLLDSPYTMAAEREVHALFLGGAGLEGAVETSAEAEDFLF